MNVGDKKLVLSMKFSGRPDVSAFAEVPHTKWFQGIVQSVSDFGLFVRPAGYDSLGLVHASRIPRDLISALKKASPVTPSANKTDIEQLFSENDVIKCRVHAVNVASRRLELSMLPYRTSDDEEDDYVVEGREPEGEETNMRDQLDEDEEGETFSAEETLLWWRGKPYAQVEEEETVEDEEIEILNESAKVIEGTWRRLFEIDMREDELDFSSKIAEEERKELEEELGELMGLDEDMVGSEDYLNLGTSFKVNKVGAAVALGKGLKDLPEEWKSQLSFFSDLETHETTKLASLRRGKVAEQEDFDSLLREVESELDSQNRSPAPRRQQVEEEQPPVIAEEPAAASE